MIYALGSVHEKFGDSESKPFENRSKGVIPGRARRKEQLSHSKLKQAFLIDSDSKLFMYLIQQQQQVYSVLPFCTGITD